MSIREKLWGTGKKTTQEEVVELTNQFYVTLRAYFTQIKKEGEANVRNKEAFNRIKALLEPPQGEEAVQNWTNAYEIEQLLVHLFDDDTIETELAVRILEARSILRPELAAMYDAQFDDIQNPPTGGQNVNPQTVSVRRRRLLARLVNDLQWRYIVNEATRRYSKLITRRTATLSVAALTFFVGAIVLIATRQFAYGELGLLWVAGLAGTWGATFSMLATVKSRLGETKFDDLKLMKAGSVLLSRAAIGAGAACILFFFLLSGLLAGSAFPSLAGPRDGRQIPAAGTTASTPASTNPTAPNSAPSTGTPTVPPAPSSTAPTGTAPAAPPSSSPQTGTSATSPALNSAAQTGTSTPVLAVAARSQQSPSTPGTLTGTPAGQKPLDTPSASGDSAGTTRSNSAEHAGFLAPPEIALLIVWCFIAGFSEQLIPGLLASTEARAGAPVPSTTDRFRPTMGTTVAPPPRPANAPPAQPPAPQAQAGDGKPQQEPKP